MHLVFCQLTALDAFLINLGIFQKKLRLNSSKSQHRKCVESRLWLFGPINRSSETCDVVSRDNENEQVKEYVCPEERRATCYLFLRHSNVKLNTSKNHFSIELLITFNECKESTTNERSIKSICMMKIQCLSGEDAKRHMQFSYIEHGQYSNCLENNFFLRSKNCF